MWYHTLLYEKKRGVAFVVLNRPPGNLINTQMAQEMQALCAALAGDDEVRVVIVTGAGDKAFSLGADLEDEAALSQGVVSQALAKLSQPVIAALNGDALGRGLELALSCDLRLAAEGVRLGFPEVSLGLIPSDGGTQRLPRVVGRGNALEMLLLAEPLEATQAWRLGLVNKVVSPDSLMAEAEALAQRLLSLAPLALKYAKEAVTFGLDLTLGQGLRLEGDLYFLLQTTKDRLEGLRAFREKRPPQFRGK